MILVVLGSDKEISLQSSHVIGALLILLSQFGSGYYTVFSKDLLERYSPYQIITYIMTISAIAFSVLAIPEMVVFQWQEVPLLAWVSIVFSGLLGLLFGNLVWVWVVGRLGSTRASLYQNLIPIVSILVAWVFLGEVLGWFSVC